MRWTVDDYEQFGEMLAGHGVLPKRAELIRGIIIEKMPKTPLHVRLSKKLYDAFQRELPSGYTVFQDGPLRLLILNRNRTYHWCGVRWQNLGTLIPPRPSSWKRLR